MAAHRLDVAKVFLQEVLKSKRPSVEPLAATVVKSALLARRDECEEVGSEEA